MRPQSRLFIDLGPLGVFFAAYSLWDLMAATAAFMAATALALGASYALERRLARMPLITAVVVMVFGGLTLALADATFIKMKPTIVYLLFAAILTVGHVRGRAYLRLLCESAFRLRDEGWRVLTVRWIAFFLAMAVLNEAVWRTQPTDLWVNLKVFGFLPLTLAFAVAQAPLIRRTGIEDGPSAQK